MKIANSVKIKVYVKEDEDEEKIKGKMLELIHLDIEKEKLALEEQTTTGFNEKKIRIFRILLEKERHVEAFLDNLIEKMGEEVKERILMQVESRLDEKCNLFLRFSKEKLMEENELWITDQGNCFHIKINVAAFPKKKEIAVDIIRNVFKVEE